MFQSFLTSFLIESGYKTPIQNMDELFDSGIKFAYRPEHSFIFENGDETEASIVQRNSVNCPSMKLYLEWAKKNMSRLSSELNFELLHAIGYFVGENYKPLICRL